MAPRADASVRLSIGALSRATGIPIETLRTWETRYGFPVPARQPSGHRVYDAAVVPRLRRVSEALARGHRAGQVVAATESALAALLDEPAAPAPALARPSGAPADRLADLMDAVRRYDAAALSRMLLADWGRMGVLPFLADRVGPLVDEVGRGWADGRLEIRHEHFVSEQLGELLRALRAPLDERATGPVAALATLAGEQHGLGLLMAGLVAAARGLRVRVAGTDLPVREVAAFARELHARVVVISTSSAHAATAPRLLRALRRALPRPMLVVAGGRGAPASIPRVEHIADFDALDARLGRVLRGT